MRCACPCIVCSNTKGTIPYPSRPGCFLSPILRDLYTRYAVVLLVRRAGYADGHHSYTKDVVFGAGSTQSDRWDQGGTGINNMGHSDRLTKKRPVLPQTIYTTAVWDLPQIDTASRCCRCRGGGRSGPACIAGVLMAVCAVGAWAAIFDKNNISRH